MVPVSRLSVKAARNRVLAARTSLEAAALAWAIPRPAVRTCVVAFARGGFPLLHTSAFGWKLAVWAAALGQVLLAAGVVRGVDPPPEQQRPAFGPMAGSVSATGERNLS